MSDADNQVGGSGEPFSKQDQGHRGIPHDEADTDEETEEDSKPTTHPRP